MLLLTFSLNKSRWNETLHCGLFDLPLCIRIRQAPGADLNFYKQLILLRSSTAICVFWVVALLLVGLSACQAVHRQGPVDEHTELHCGSAAIQLVRHTATWCRQVTFLNVHEDEQTSIQALEKFALEHPINYCYFQHSGARRIRFSVGDSSCSIDPNRMFTDEGRRKTLKDGGFSSTVAERELRKFATNFLKGLHKAEVLVALHNNTPDNYSIHSYMPDSSEAQNTGRLYINPEMDPDDFIYTTDSVLFGKFCQHGVNAILQDASNFVDDGSLSVYCGFKKMRYVNIETEHGHLEEQLELLELVLSFLEKK